MSVIAYYSMLLFGRSSDKSITNFSFSDKKLVCYFSYLMLLSQNSMALFIFFKFNECSLFTFTALYFVIEHDLLSDF
jgi:hypothetical protein